MKPKIYSFTVLEVRHFQTRVPMGLGSMKGPRSSCAGCPPLLLLNFLSTALILFSLSPWCWSVPKSSCPYKDSSHSSHWVHSNPIKSLKLDSLSLKTFQLRSHALDTKSCKLCFFFRVISRLATDDLQLTVAQHFSKFLLHWGDSVRLAADLSLALNVTWETWPSLTEHQLPHL